MARFPYYRKNIQDLGRLLARARVDPVCRKELVENPKKQLRLIGLPENVVALINFKIVDEPDGQVSVIPYRLNQAALDKEDTGYLEGLTDLFPVLDDADSKDETLN